MKGDAFVQGFACAVAYLIREHDEPSIALGLLRDNGFDLDDLKEAKVAPYDYNVIKKAINRGK